MFVKKLLVMNIEGCFFSPFFHSRAKRSSFVVAVYLLLSLFFTLSASAEPLLYGIDRLEASGFVELAGLKVGLITNVAGVSRTGEPNYAIMLRNGVRLKFIMAPEHGFSADI